MIGRTVTHYRIVDKLGGGGMGVVYRAEDLKLGRTVALKFLPPETVRDDEAKRRFFHEARAAAALDHPNICTVYEVDETPEGDVFLAMACYEGETLKERIARGSLSVEEAVRIALQACDGLVRAHQRGIVHRDIKPANIMLTADGTVKILDFGLAKLAGQTALTQTGATLGTVTYMAPEQARGAAVDGRADVWALGAVLYEMVTGRPPFAGEYAQAVIYSILNESPDPPSRLRPDLPAALETAIARAMAKDPAQRFPGIAELAAALRALGLDPATSPPLAETHPLTVSPGSAPGARPAGASDVENVSAGMARPRPPWWLYAAAIPFVFYTLFITFLYFFGLESPGYQYSRSGGRILLTEVKDNSAAAQSVHRAGDRYRRSGGGILLTEVRVNSAAAQSGLRAGDLIVTVDGRPATLEEMRRFFQFAEEGRKYQLDYVRHETSHRATLVLGQKSWRFWLSQDGLNDLGHIFISMVFLVLAVLIAFSRSRDSVVLTGAFWMATWSIPMTWLLVGVPPGFDRVIGGLPLPLAVAILLAPIIAIGLSAELGFIFMASFPRRIFQARWVYVVLWLSALPRFAIMGYAILSSHLALDPFVLWPGVLQVFASIRFLYWIGAIGLLIYNFRTLQDKNERRRLRLLFIGLCTFFILALVHTLCSVKMWEFQRTLIIFYWKTPMPLVVSLLLAMSVALVAVAIVRQRLFGLRMMIRRGLQYAAARGLLLALAPACAAVLVGDLLLHADQPLGAILASRGWFYAALGIGGGVAHFKRKHWLEGLDRRFFRERYDARRILADLVHEIRQAGDIASAARRVTTRITAALHAEYAALLMRDPSAPAFYIMAAACGPSAPASSTPADPATLALHQAPLPASGKLITLIRVLEKPVEISTSESNWLRKQLPASETAWLQKVRIEWLFPVRLGAGGAEILLALGPKRSEEPYSQEDQDLLAAVTGALALRMDAPSASAPPQPWAPVLR